MRILHVTDTYSPTLGGIEVLVASLSAHQRSAGHQVSVLTRTAAPPGEAGVYREPRLLADLVSQADCVHAHVSAISPLALRAAEVAAQREVPVVATVHSMWGAGWPIVRAGALLRGWPDLPVQWAAVSEAAAVSVRKVVRRDAPAEAGPVLVLPNAIDTAAWAPLPPRGGTGEVTVVAVQRMVRRKRPLPLVDILRRARDLVPPQVTMRAVLVGDGPQLPMLRSRLERAGLSSWVDTPGALSHQQLRELYRDADIFVAPASLESFGLAALEARTAGLAVLGREGTGVGDFAPHGTAGLLAADDVQLAHDLALLCQDGRRLAAMKAHNRAHRPAFDWTDILWRNDEAYAAAAGLLGTRTAPGSDAQRMLPV